MRRPIIADGRDEIQAYFQRGIDAAGHIDAIRILASGRSGDHLPRHRARHPACGPRARRGHHGIWCALPWPAQRVWSQDRVLAKGDIRSVLPRFASGNLDQNLSAVDALRAVAHRLGATVAQVAIAWVVSKGRDIVPLVGARRRDRLTEALGALDLTLTAESVATIEAALSAGAVAGTRYDPHQMAVLDGERASGSAH